MVLAVFGSTSTWFTPRPEPKLDMTAPPGRSGLRQTAVGFPISVKVAPLSVDCQMLIGGKFGVNEHVPPDGTATPRTPRPEPTQTVLPLTTIELIEQPSNAGPV